MKLTLHQLEADLSSSLPPDLVKRLLKAYEEIKENFYIGRHEPAELHGGKLCEIVARLLEHEVGLAPTPITKPIKNMGDFLRGFENKSHANDSIRFHIPRVASALYNIRNNRGVGHVGGDVDPNLADATFVAAGADWILAEFVRLHYNCSLADAQALVNGLVQRKLPLVMDIDGTRRVLNPDLTYAERTLLVLSSTFPNSVGESTVFSWVEHSNSTVYRRAVLRPLHKKKLIEYSQGTCRILPPGMLLVEQNYLKWSSFEPALSGKRAKR